MKRVAVLVVLGCLAGCSNAPIAGFLDYCFPTKGAGLGPERPRDGAPPERISPPELGPPVAGPVVPKGN
jgi:hypothetical protein